MKTNATLSRRLSTLDATMIGLGSMIGAGVFAAFVPAAQAAGAGLLIGLLIAAFVAWCNAAASAQLAAVYPVAGGTYVYGRELLGHCVIPLVGVAVGALIVILGIPVRLLSNRQSRLLSDLGA